MKNKILVGILTGLLLLCMGGVAQAALVYDANVHPNVIMGTGIGNGSWTVDLASGVQIGLRGKTRHNGSGVPDGTYNSNGDGTYSFAAGVAPTQSFPTAVWSFEWSINTTVPFLGPSNLAGLTYKLGLDIDPGFGTNFIEFDPINGINPKYGTVSWDHSIGNNFTPQSGGVEVNTNDPSAYALLVNGNNVAQNSWKPHWFNSGFDPTVDGTYDIYLGAFNGTNQIALSEIQIIVGNPVPLPAAVWLLGSGLLGLAGYRRKQNR